MSLPTSSPAATLRILQTTDLHMSVLPYDYLTDRDKSGASLIELAPLISSLKNGDVTTCLFDTGDFLQGNALADLAIQAVPLTQNHPMITAMNALGYDAVALGNHEFDYGLIALMRALDGLACPALLANVTDENATPFFTPSTMLVRDVTADDGQTYPIRIGVIGLVTPSTVIAYDSADPIHLSTDSMSQAAAAQATILRQAGADIIVALCHAGVTPHDTVETAAQVAALPQIDVVLGGHVHDLFPDRTRPDTDIVDQQRGTVAGTPTVMAGAFGQHLGQIELHLTQKGGRWCIADHQISILPATSRPDTPSRATISIKAAAGDAHRRTLTHIRMPLATTRTSINSFFAQIAPDTSLQLLANSNRAAMRAILDQQGIADLPVLTAVSPFCVGRRGGPDYFVDIPAGPITVRAARAIIPFDNKLLIARQTTADLINRLERASGQFHQIHTNVADQILIDQCYPPYNADTIFGLTYRIDLSKPVGAGRVHDLRYQGRSLAPDDVFAVGMSTHRALGGGGYAPVSECDTLYQSPYAIFEHLISYLRTQRTLETVPEQVWEFDTVTGASTLFQTSPKGASHMDGLGLSISRLRVEPDGFATYRLSMDQT